MINFFTKSININLVTTKLILLLLFPLNVMAVDWPGSGDCSGTLQACINAESSSGVVIVKTNSVINESSLLIEKDLYLSAGVGFKPIFRNMDMDIDVPMDNTVTIQNFQFELASDIFVTLKNSAQINILSNTWSNPDKVIGQKEGITVYSQNSNTVANIKHNTIISEGYNGPGTPLIQISHYTPGLFQVNIHDNQLVKLDSDPDTFSRLVYIQNISSGTIDAQVVANTMKGSINPVYILQSNENTATMNLGLVSNLITGVIDKNTVIDANPLNTAILSQIDVGNFYGIFGNNTIDGVGRTEGNTSLGMDFRNHTTTASSSIIVFGNIFVNTFAAYLGPTTGTSTSFSSGGYNLFFNHGSISGLSLSSSDLNAPPFFVNEGINYALQQQSSAIDIVNSSVVSSLYSTEFMSGSPSIDADGLRRYKGARIDAGAYEWGDRHILHKSEMPHPVIPNATTIDDQELNNNNNAVLIVSQIWNYPGEDEVYNNQSIGVYRTNSEWRIFNQNPSIDMPINAKFHVYYPYGSIGSSLNGLSVYRSLDDSVSGFELDDSLLNNNPSAGVFTTNFWDSLDGGIYNNHPLEIAYKTSTNKWFLNNADSSNMPLNAKFNIYNQDKSRNVFHHEVSQENSIANTTRIDHPLLDNTPCALPTVTQSSTWFFGPLFGQNPNNIGLYYSNGHWRIFNQNGLDINIGTGKDAIPGGRFMVMVDPQQVYQCKANDLIFENGFE